VNECPYKTLGIKPGASVAQIKAAYRRQAQINHPDRHGDKSPEERTAFSQQFQRAQAAYDLLSDPEQRAYYDRHGESRAAAAARITPEMAATLVEAFKAVMPNPRAGGWVVPKREDLVRQMRLHLTDKLEDIRRLAQQARGIVKELRAFEGRILCRDSAENPINQALAAEIAGIEAKIVDADKEAEHFKACLTELQFWRDGAVVEEPAGDAGRYVRVTYPVPKLERGVFFGGVTTA
jgi:curved DNA-binding protein CbpA